MNMRDGLYALLRMAIGWHFLYEGVWKLVQENWSAKGFLQSSDWFAGPLFKALAANSAVMRGIDFANEWGLVLIGLGLIAGVLARWAAGAGALLLFFYYVCQPPWLNATGDAHYLFLDVRLVEALALGVLVCTPGPGIGDVLRGLWAKIRKAPAPETERLGRREWLGGLAACGVLATFGGLFARWKWGPKVDAVTSATAKAFEFTGLDKLSHPIDQFLQIGQLKLSRLILGGGMISGYAHPRDLKYLSGPSGLMKAYNTPDRTRHTLAFAEKAGINTIIINPLLIDTVTDYWKRTGGKIQFITNCGYHGAPGAGEEEIAKGLVKGAQMSVDRGAASCFMRGEYTDNMAVKGQDKLLEDGEVLPRARHRAGLLDAHVQQPKLLERDPLLRHEPRQLLVHGSRGAQGLHAHREAAVDRVQGARRRRHPSARGLPVRVQQRRGRHLRRHVRLPDGREREPREQDLREGTPRTEAPLAFVGAWA